MEGIGSTENTTVDDQDTLGRLSYSRSSTLLRRERRMARNRFLFMFFAFLALPLCHPLFHAAMTCLGF